MTAENSDESHATQADSVCVLGSSDSQFDPKPGPHVVWSWHAERSSSRLYSLSAAEQSSHTISVEGVPAVSLPRPALQFDQGLHDVSAFVSVLKWVEAHAVHVASAVLFADSVKYSPAAHGDYMDEHGGAVFVSNLKWVE